VQGLVGLRRWHRLKVLRRRRCLQELDCRQREEDDPDLDRADIFRLYLIVSLCNVRSSLKAVSVMVHRDYSSDPCLGWSCATTSPSLPSDSNKAAQTQGRFGFGRMRVPNRVLTDLLTDFS